MALTTGRRHILTIGGGSGQFALLSGLRDLPRTDITAVVSMVDSGGSTGRLRDELGTLPPGDILKCILALSPHREMARTILLKRFKKDRRLMGHNAGNMLLTMLSRYTGSFITGVQALAEILDVHGSILPVTVDQATLVAELTDGTRIFGETAIDMPRGTQRERIKDVYLVPHHSDGISVFPPVLDAVAHADCIVIGPGDLFTSIMPNLLVPGVCRALQHTSALLLYVVNIMTKYGETHDFTVDDFIHHLESTLKRPVDGIVLNTRKPNAALIEAYRGQKSSFVSLDLQKTAIDKHRLFKADLLDTSGGIVRHDSTKLAAFIHKVISGR